MNKCYDDIMALFNLIKENVSNMDINILLNEDKNNSCHFILVPIEKADIEYMTTFYDKIRFNLYSHNYIADVKMHEKGIYIKFK